jgi:BlaI family transcriptional regulator, penicillinase repressor
MRHASTQPTDVELSILNVLWDRGPSTVRQVHEVLAAQKEVAYTSVLKMLQTMFDKELVVRDDTERSHVYGAALERLQTQRGLLRDLLDRAFGGSARELVLLALQAEKLKPAEKAEIQRLLDGRKR